MISRSTDELQLKPFDFEFFEDIWDYSKNIELYTFLEYNGFATRDEFLNWILEKLSRGELLVILDKKTNKCLGTISISEIDYKRMSCSIGYALDLRVQRQNIFGRSLNMLLASLQKIGFVRVWAITSKSNIRSINALLKKGFVTEGTMRSYYHTAEGERIDALLLSNLLN